MNELVKEQLFVDHTHQSDFFEDFHQYDTTNTWVLTTNTGPTAALVVTGDTAVAVSTSAADNKEGLLATKMLWDITSGRPSLFEARAKCPEAATSAANYFIGHCSVGQTSAVLVNDGGGLVASFSGFGFYKVDGGTYWKFASSVAATRYGDNTSRSAAGQTGYVSFRVECRPISSTECEIAPLIDLNGGNNYSQLKDYTSGLLIKHILTYTSYAPAYLTLGVKSGSASQEVMTVDWARTSQRR